MINLLLKRDVIETIIPTAGVAITRLSGVSGAWSAYGELISAANLTYDFILCGAYLYERLFSASSGLSATCCTYQVATGEAGSEVPIAEDRTMMSLYEATVGDGMMSFRGSTLLFPPMLIPASTRLSYRNSSDSAVAQRGSLYLVGYKATDWGLPLTYLKDSIAYMKGLAVVAKGAVCYPALGKTTVTTGNPAWTDGAAVELVASATSPTLITGAHGVGVATATAGLCAHAKICIGSVGNEKDHSEVAFANAASQVGPLGASVLPRPLLVKTGERISVIAHGSVAAKNVGVSLQGFELK